MLHQTCGAVICSGKKLCRKIRAQWEETGDEENGDERSQHEEAGDEDERSQHESEAGSEDFKVRGVRGEQQAWSLEVQCEKRQHQIRP